VRIGLFSDIHGNAVGFDALLADLERCPVDRLVCLGDTVQGGPQPVECAERLRALACPVVMGNADWFVLTGEPGAEPVTERQEAVRRWTLARLSEADREFVRSFRPTVDEPPVLGFHGSPRSFDDVILPLTPEDEFRSLLAGYDAPILTGGHVHQQFVRRLGSSLFMNPGSVGLSYDPEQPEDAMRFDAWAAWAVVDVDGDRLSVEFRRAPFDAGAVVEAIEASGIPGASRVSGWTDSSPESHA
jgi:predicted phosphodiesterase